MNIIAFWYNWRAIVCWQIHQAFSVAPQRKRGQVILRHTELTAYRCFLPDLAGFTGFGCTGPGPLILGAIYV